MVIELLESPTKRWNTARLYKQDNHIQGFKKEKVSLDEIDEVAHLLSANVTVLDEFGKTVVASPVIPGWPQAVVRASNGHIVALIPKEQLQAHFSQEFIDELPMQNKKNALPTCIQPLQTASGKKDIKIATYDLETMTAVQIPNVYLSGLSRLVEGLITNHQFKGDRNNLQKFFQFLVDNAESLDGYILYAHCGGRFDLNLLIRDVLS